jgi:hypothetical protein
MLSHHKDPGNFHTSVSSKASKQRLVATHQISLHCDPDRLSFPDWRTRNDNSLRTGDTWDAELLSCVLTRDRRWSNGLGTCSVSALIDSLTLKPYQSTIKKNMVQYKLVRRLSKVLISLGFWTLLRSHLLLLGSLAH